MCVRYEGNEHSQITNLITHHSITDAISQTHEFICILGIVEESLNLPLLSQWIEFSEDIFQFPNGTGLLNFD